MNASGEVNNHAEDFVDENPAGAGFRGGGCTRKHSDLMFGHRVLLTTPFAQSPDNGFVRGVGIYVHSRWVRPHRIKEALARISLLDSWPVTNRS